MNDDDQNMVQKIILEMGGYGAFSRKMGNGQNTSTLRDIASGKRVPGDIVRRRIVRASRGRLSEADIIAITGKESAGSQAPYNPVDPMWEAGEDERRQMIAKRASDAAKRQRKENERRKR